MANRYQGPMQVQSDDAPRPWLSDGYPADSAARDQDVNKGVIFKRPVKEEEDAEA